MSNRPKTGHPWYKWVAALAITLSLLVLALAGIYGPADGQPPSPALSAERESGSTGDWCELMDAKPNNQWRGDDFKRYAELCLD
ncbi:MAG: DUF3012 domain-containing protein [Cellvibrionaceae bacterium]|nr:DUF3012 domain-containing protein [Cellvibrionaceae bacterium]